MKASFFANNRQRLRQEIGKTPIVLTAFRAMQYSNDDSGEFLQEANFWWLTGIEEPDWQVVMTHDDEWLIAPTVDLIHQTFNGGQNWDEIRTVSGIDKILTLDEGKELIKTLSHASSKVLTLGKDPRAKHYDFVMNPAPAQLQARLKKEFKIVADCRLELARLRAIKQPEEIEAIKKAIDLTVEAFREVKSNLQSFKHEYEIEAFFTHHFRHHGTKGHAYAPIVASGGHACTLHYGKNSEPLAKNELLLLDIGARVDGYAADITRTYGVGDPSERQKAVHKAVEKAHREIITLLKPGLKLEDYSNQVDQSMKAALADLGLLKTENDYRKYFPHAISHGLGIDVHDALGRPTELRPGMILTVEPGIYIPEEGIGVRIEDDILITETGHENLSAALPTSL